MFILALALLAAATGILITLTVIDLKTQLLPNPLNLALAISGILFHFIIGFKILPASDLVFGAALGAGLLYIIRLGGNIYYKQESLGLGDVKLLGAAGFWLGLEGTLTAIIAGAAAGVVHGMIIAGITAHKNKTQYSLKRLIFPAGPGFCAGIFLTGTWIIYPYLADHL